MAIINAAQFENRAKYAFANQNYQDSKLVVHNKLIVRKNDIG